MYLIHFYPWIFSKEGLKVYEPVLMQEMAMMLKGFDKSKSSGMDRCPVEFFLEFWDLMGPDLLDVVEESKRKEFVSGELNATIFTLVPKKYKPSSFKDFRPIYLCNLIYKVILKVNSSRLKLVLSNFLSKEQFGFLKNQQIFDVVGVSQECMHSI